MPDFNDHDSNDSNASSNESTSDNGSDPQLENRERTREASLADRMMEQATKAMDSFGMGPLGLQFDAKTGRANATLNINSGQISGLGKLLNDLNLAKLLRGFDVGPFEFGASIQKDPNKAGGYCGSYFFGLGAGLPFVAGVSTGLEVTTCGKLSLTQVTRVSLGSANFTAQQHEVTRSEWNRTLSALAEDRPPRW